MNKKSLGTGKKPERIPKITTSSMSELKLIVAAGPGAEFAWRSRALSAGQPRARVWVRGSCGSRHIISTA